MKKKETKYGVIYVLEDPRESEPKKRIRYVGQTISRPRRRLLDHIYKAQSKNGKSGRHICCWIRKLLKENVLPTMEVVADAFSRKELDVLEIKWIRDLRQKGYKLTNYNDGGKGNKGFHHSAATRRKMSKSHQNMSLETRHKIAEASRNRVVTEATRRKLSAINKGRPKSEEHKAKLRGRTFSDEHRKNISIAAKKRLPPSEEKKEQVRQKMKAVWADMSDEERKRRSQVFVGRVFSEEARRRISKSRKGQKNSPEAIEKIRQAKLGKKASKETREKMSIAQKKIWRKREQSDPGAGKGRMAKLREKRWPKKQDSPK